MKIKITKSSNEDEDQNEDEDEDEDEDVDQDQQITWTSSWVGKSRRATMLHSLQKESKRRLCWSLSSCVHMSQYRWSNIQHCIWRVPSFSCTCSFFPLTRNITLQVIPVHHLVSAASCNHGLRNPRYQCFDRRTASGSRQSSRSEHQVGVGVTRLLRHSTVPTSTQTYTHHITHHAHL